MINLTKTGLPGGRSRCIKYFLLYNHNFPFSYLNLNLFLKQTSKQALLSKKSVSGYKCVFILVLFGIQARKTVGWCLLLGGRRGFLFFWRFRDDVFGVIRSNIILGTWRIALYPLSYLLICLSTCSQTILEVMKQWQMLGDKIRYASRLYCIILLSERAMW